MKRVLIGIVLGAFAAYLLIYAVDRMVIAIFPVVPATDPTMIAHADGAITPERLPLAARLLTVLGWGVGSAVGGAAAAGLAHRRVAAWVVAAFVVTVAVERSSGASHPDWMIAAGLVLPWACAWAVQPVAAWRRRRY